jgi:hypothetical protein
MEPNKTFHYGFHCVAFLDILGQRRKLRQLPLLPKRDEETTKLLAETAGYVLRLRQLLSDCFEQFRKPTLFLSKLPQDAQTRILNARHAVKYRGFSDSIIMTISFKDDQEQCAPMIGVFGCIAACCMLHLLALSFKRPIRGGIDVGLGLELTDDEVYGPVLESAHFLESQVADYPRVLVGEGLSKYLNEVENHSATTPLGLLAQQLALRCNQFLTVDTDGFRMLDFLGEEMAKVTPPDQRKKLFRPANDYINEQKQIADSEGNHKHLSRYVRLGSYFDKQSKLWS